MSNFKIVLNAALLIGTALIVSACQTVPYQGQARDVKRRPGAGGIIGVPLNPQQADRDRATEHMISNCGQGNYRVTSEEEVVTGEQTSTDARNDYRPNTQHRSGSFLGMPVYSGDQGGNDTHESTTRTQMKEWQMGYECGAGAPAVPPLPPPIAAPAKAKKKK